MHQKHKHEFAKFCALFRYPSIRLLGYLNSAQNLANSCLCFWCMHILHFESRCVEDDSIFG